jgi:hypothetical protein
MHEMVLAAQTGTVRGTQTVLVRGTRGLSSWEQIRHPLLVKHHGRSRSGFSFLGEIRFKRRRKRAASWIGITVFELRTSSAASMSRP